MYQKCPICDGYSSFIPQIRCNVCLGTGLISSVNGRPPFREDLMKQDPPKTEKSDKEKVGKAKKKRPIGFQITKPKIKTVEEEIKLPEVKKDDITKPTIGPPTGD